MATKTIYGLPQLWKGSGVAIFRSLGMVLMCGFFALLVWLKLAVAQAERSSFDDIAVVMSAYETDRFAIKKQIRPSVVSCLGVHGEGSEPPEPLVDYFTSFSKFAYRNLDGTAANWMEAMGPFVEREIVKLSAELAALPEAEILAAADYMEPMTDDPVDLLGCVSTGVLRRRAEADA